MGAIIGQAEYQKFKKGETLTTKEAILAQCYSCNGRNESREDCKGYTCSLYPYSPYGDESNYPYQLRKSTSKGNIEALRKARKSLSSDF